MSSEYELWVQIHQALCKKLFYCACNCFCFSEILGAMQDPDAGVNLGSHVRNGAVHKNCFTGKNISLPSYSSDL